MKILPLGTDLNVRAYPNHLFLDAIANNSATTGDEIVCLNIDNLEASIWEKHQNEAEIKLLNDKVHIKQNGYVDLSYKCIYRKMNLNDEINFRIDYQQYTNRWDSIVIFIDDNINNFEHYSKMRYTVGRYCSGDFFSLIDGKYQMYNTKLDSFKYPIYMKLKIDNSLILSYYSYDEILWNSINSTQDIKLVETKDYYIGINIDMDDNQYYKWLFNNYIQLRYDVNEEKKIDYCDIPKRDWRCYTIHPIISMAYEKKSIIVGYNLSLWNYIKTNIDNNRYIEFWLNEFYVIGMKAYKHYNYSHESLVYGYDEDEQNIKMLSVLAGKPKLTDIKISEFQQAWDTADNNEKVYTFEYNPNNVPYDIDKKRIYCMMNDYLSGENSTEYTTNLIPKEDAIFGIEIYDTILDSDDNKNIFLSDRRIAYLICEHKKCMYERAKYIGYLKWINNKDLDIILQQLSDIYDISQIILNLTLKNQIKQSRKIKISIFEEMIKMRDAEKICYKKVVNILKTTK